MCLAGAGIDKSALEVSLDGADSGVLKTTPDFVKSLPLAKALDENTLIAFEMNGEPLPHWNGFPARLIIPGWTATYWMKHLTAVNVISKPFDGFWMKTAYRIPKDRFPSGQFSLTGNRDDYADHGDGGKFIDHQPGGWTDLASRPSRWRSRA